MDSFKYVPLYGISRNKLDFVLYSTVCTHPEPGFVKTLYVVRLLQLLTSLMLYFSFTDMDEENWSS